MSANTAGKEWQSDTPVNSRLVIKHSGTASTLVRLLVGIFLFSLVLGGSLRYFLGVAHIFPLVYLPKALLLGAVPLLLLIRKRVSRSALFLLGLIFWSLAAGVLLLPSVAQAFFGLWVVVPLLFGAVAAPYIFSSPDSYTRMIWWLFWIAALGVLVNPIIHYPWIGASLHFSGVDLSVARHWYTGVFQRYPGFSNASFAAASQLAVFAIWLFVTLRSRRLAVLVWLVAGMGILFTTSKGPLLAYLVVSAYFFTQSISHRRMQHLFVVGWISALWMTLFALVLLPLSTLFVHYDPSFHHGWQRLMFTSFGDRLNWMWPNSLRLLSTSWEWGTGRGLGGIGAPQQYFDPVHYLAGDNLFVYLAVDLGVILTLVLMMALGVRLTRAFACGRLHPLIFPLTLFTLAYGIVVNVVEEPLLLFVLSVCIVALWARWDIKDVRRY